MNSFKQKPFSLLLESLEDSLLLAIPTSTTYRVNQILSTEECFSPFNTFNAELKKFLKYLKNDPTQIEQNEILIKIRTNVLLLFWAISEIKRHNKDPRVDVIFAKLADNEIIHNDSKLIPILEQFSSFLSEIENFKEIPQMSENSNWFSFRGIHFPKIPFLWKFQEESLN